ncbi:uncharacterized protein LOC123503841 isoform X2 [Portunus trituberculatus]|uniref:uncharacterized protein LOC123503841 isoform X2 n=1 Tax=Portunus trituberculatus TaxID=210409 RepID=UPI001E1D1DD4|nr:uncharacterized protein LOC123503841 isoform X2 [Portunus trituberculatus]XP_045109867.1 uncharacterized protein LOC123503841 isoform X2 [Portunus trituberculatus]XP_045109868.1 uncharacterized protein LOC123503841 isoform X2 [Portunus trituberculatus]
MLAGTLLLSTVAFHLAEALQISHAASHSSTVAALRRFKSFSCTTRRDGVYPELASSCSYYYRCLDGAVFSYVCPPGQAFHYPTEECRPAGEVTCPHLPPASPPCINQSDGYYPDYRQDCKSYYRCTNSSLSGRWQCGSDAVWDSSTGSCGTGSLLVCSPPSCWGLPDGPHPSPGSSCTAYFTCAGGVRTDHVCPYNSIFDYTLKRCVAGKSSVCYEQACEGRVNGLHAVPHAPCNSFFRCFNGALVKVEECPKHQIFDGRRCVSERNFSCWGEGRGSCDGKDDGFHVSPDADCRAFFLCHQQQFIRAYKCSPGLMFNGKECVDGRNSICNPGSSLPDCSSKIDGYYTMEKSECKTFFYCQGGSKMSEHTCPGNNVFNGEHCVDSVLFRCPSHQELQHTRNFTNSVVRTRRSSTATVSDAGCGEGDGHYAHLSSGCRTFHVCRSGLRVNHMCPAEQIFNGVQCVPASHFTCPAMSSCQGRDTGWYQDFSSNCTKFFYCYNGYQHELTCPSEQIFDGRACVPSSTYNCPKAARDHDCLGRKTGFYSDTDSSCLKYFACKNGVKVQTLTCPEKHVFNGEVCVPSTTASCLPSEVSVSPNLMSTAMSAAFTQENVISRSSVSVKGLKDTSVFQHLERETQDNMAGLHNSGVKKEQLSQNMCSDLPNGRYAEIHSRCNSFLECGDRPRWSRCPNALVFSPSNNACVSPDRYACPTTNPCQSLSDGIHADGQSQCRIFFTCLGKRTILITSCPEGQAFSEADGRCRSEGVSCGGTDSAPV